MRILVEGDESANVLSGYLQKSGYIPGDKNGYNYKITLKETEEPYVVVDGIDCDLERRIVYQMELNGIPEFLLRRIGGSRSDREITILYPKKYQTQVEKGVYQGLMVELNNYQFKRERQNGKITKLAAVFTLLLTLLAVSQAHSQVNNFPVVRFFDIDLNIVNAGDFANSAIRVNCIVGCGGGPGGGGDVNLIEILGSAPSNTNPLATRLTDGTNYYNALTDTQLRASAVNIEIDQTGNNNDVDVLSMPDNITVDLNRIAGAAPSAANPLPVRTSDGAAFIDPRVIVDGSAAGHADVIATDPAGTENGLVVRSIGSESTEATAAWTSATALNSTISIALAGMGHVTVTYVPTSPAFTAGRIQFQISKDNTNWINVPCPRNNGGVEGVFLVSNALAAASWNCTTGPATNFRLLLNEVITGTGTANMTIQASSVAPGQLVGFLPVMLPTYSAYKATTAGAAVDIINIFNASGSGRLVRVVKIVVAFTHTAAITTVINNIEISKTTTAGATCTGSAFTSMDSLNPTLPATITSSGACTTDPTVGTIIQACTAGGEEGTAAGPTVNGVAVCYEFTSNFMQPISLYEGQGVMLKTVGTLAATGIVAATIFFTVQGT